MTAEELMKLLDLEPLTMEGGYFRRSYLHRETTPEGKPVATAIYYLLTPDTFSRMHKLPSDEVYHFYLGDPVELLVLHPNGDSEKIVLGKEIENGMKVQFAVPAGSWQGSCLAPGGTWALLGTTMAPGFTDDDFIPGERQKLMKAYAAFAREIERLT